MYAEHFCEWLEFNAIEPFGDERRYMALIAYISAIKGGAKELTLEKCMGIAKKNESPTESAAGPKTTQEIADALCAHFGVSAPILASE